MGHAEAFAPVFSLFVEVNANDLSGACKPQALNDVEANAAEAKDNGSGTHFNLGRVDDGTDAGGDAAADIADLVEGGVGAHFGQGNFGQHRVVREGGTAHVVVDRLALVGKARGAIGHQALALGGADFLAQIGLGVQAILAFAAFRRVERNDMIALLQRFHACAHIHHNASAFMAHDGRKQAFGIGA